MVRSILSVLLVAAAIGIFYGFTNPLFEAVQQTRTQSARLDEVLEDSRRVQILRDSLLEEFNTISDTELRKLRNLLPDNINNISLVLEVDRIASQAGLVLESIRVADEEDDEEEEDGAGGGGELGPSDEPFGSIRIGFTFSGTYTALRDFISEFERNLRLVDIIGLSFLANEEGSANTYTLQVRTYWLK